MGSKPSCDLKPFSTKVTFEANMFYYKLVLMTALFLAHFGMCQDFIKESNMWQLDKDSFWKIAHRMEIHSVIVSTLHLVLRLRGGVIEPSLRVLAQKYNC